MSKERMDRWSDTTKEILDQIPNGLTRTQVEEFTGINNTTIQSWERKNLITPERMVRGGVFYPDIQIARLIIIKDMKDEGWAHEDICSELRVPAYIARNKDVFDRFFEGRKKRI